jgi:hypothetical protein
MGIATSSDSGRGRAMTLSRGRRLLGAASLGAAAAVLATFVTWDKAVLGLAALVGAGAIALGRRSVFSQVLGRGVAWLVLTPSLLGVLASLRHGHLPDARTALFCASSAAALLLARPALHTAEACADFAPVRYRRLFLAGAVASAMTGAGATLFAAWAMRWGEVRIGLGLGALGVGLLASAVGVVRMRAWGVLLAMLASLATLAAAALLSGGEGPAFALALAAIPGALLAAPLLVARVEAARGGRARAPGSAGHRLRAPEVLEVDEPPPPVRARVGVVAEDEREELGHPGSAAVGSK